MAKLSVGSLSYELSNNGFTTAGIIGSIFKAPEVTMITIKNGRTQYITLHRKNGGISKSSRSALGKEIQEKLTKRTITPPLVGLVILVLIGEVLANVALPLILVTGLVGFFSILVAREYDTLSKSVGVFYRMDKQAQAKYQTLFSTFSELKNNQAVWTTEERTNLDEWKDQKKQGGATSLVSRTKVLPSISFLPYRISTNIKIPTIPLNNLTLCFLPDVLMILSAKNVSFVNYKSIEIDSTSTRFVEESKAAVPNDAIVVGETWKYVNKDGSPDKRFSNNAILPIANYGVIQLSLPPTVRASVQTSRQDSAVKVTEGLRQYMQNFN